MLAAMRLAALATASVLLLPAPVLAQSGGSADAGRPLPVSHATRAQGAVRMDGRLDEPDWATATPTDGFTQIEPAEGQPATSRTEVRVLYDDAYLYVGVRMQDTVRPRARPGRRLEILPYTLAKSSFVDPGANPFRSNPDHRAAAGVDLLYGVTSNLTLNAAFNPDFGQVEVDPAVINLGVYETFFAEKRPFFIEGSEIFDFGAHRTSGGQGYYSRRIGRVPTLVPPWPASDVPDITTILGAGKLSGKAGGWSVGAIEAVTSKEEARYRTTTVPDCRFAVEPLSSYFAGRARREWRGGQ